MSESSKYSILFAIVVLAIAGIFGAAMLSITHGHLVAPLDDSYIHFQYARRLSQGHWFEYSEGSGFSTGATSVLYPLVLTPFFWLGFHGVKILLVSYALGVICLFATAFFLYRLGRDLVGEGGGVLAGLFFLVNGNLAWNYLSGMETGLFATLLIIGFHLLLRWWLERRGRLLCGAFLIFSLASLTRPEGFFILALCAAGVFSRAYRIHGRRCLYLLGSLLPFVAYMIMVYVKCETFATAGILAKSVSAAPYYSFWEKIAKLADNFALIFWGYYRNLANSFFPEEAMIPFFPEGALYPFLLFPPAAFILALFGFVLGTTHKEQRGRSGPLILITLSLFVGLVTVTNSVAIAGHNFRYLSPYQPLFLLLVVVGIRELTSLLGAAGMRTFRIIGMICVIFMIPSVIYWAYYYGENGNDLFEQHRRTSWWIKDATPPDAVIGVTDTGIIGYFGERRIYDFVGLTTPRQARHWRQGRGSAYERLEHLAPEDLPDYIVSFPFVWGENNFLGHPVHGAPLRKNLTTMSHEFVVYQQEWSFLKKGEQPQNPSPEMILSDSVDVADLDDEREHDYQWKEQSERPAGWKFPNPRNFFHKAPGPNGIIADGGRGLFETETFTVELKPEKPVLFIARTESTEVSIVKVYMNGKRVGHLMAVSDKKDSWQELSLTIGADFISKGANRVRIEFDPDKSRARTFHSYHYWFFQ